MDPPTTRKIPRPWLERRQISVHAAGGAQHFVFAGQPPPVLLEKPNPFKSFLKFDWCCRAPKEQQQPQPFYPASPIILSQRGHHHVQDSFDTSSFHLAPRPTVIYVIQGDPSQIPPSPKDSKENWHESYLSFGSFSSQNSPRPQRPSVVMNRRTSCDTDFTSLSCDDSLVFSDGFSSSRGDLLYQSPHQRQPSPSAARPNGIPRPPRMQQKSKTAGPVLMNSSSRSMNSNTNSKSPSPTNRTRSATMDSTISTGSRHRRQHFLMDQETVDQTFCSVDWDDDDDNSLALGSENSESPIFPLLDHDSGQGDSALFDKRHRSSPRSQSSEKVEPELYLPKCSSLEEARKANDRTILMSGWVAYSKGDSLLHKRRVTRKHLGYLVVYADEPNEIYFEQPPASSFCNTSSNSGEGTSEEEPRETVVIKLPSTNVSIQTEECEGGRSVVIRADSRVLCTILPMNLPSSVFDAACSKIVRPPLPAPVPTFAQHDAALHLWFGLDGWMRRQQKQLQAQPQPSKVWK